MKEKIYITWDDFHKKTKGLANKIKESKVDISGILTITRGGMVPSCILAHELDIKNIKSIALSSYDKSNNLSEVVSITNLEEIKVGSGKGWLIVDELVDTGNTLDYLKQNFPEAKFASVIQKIDNSHIDFCFEKQPKDSWIVFPWEK